MNRFQETFCGFLNLLCRPSAALAAAVSLAAGACAAAGQPEAARAETAGEAEEAPGAPPFVEASVWARAHAALVGAAVGIGADAAEIRAAADGLRGWGADAGDRLEVAGRAPGIEPFAADRLERLANEVRASTSALGDRIRGIADRAANDPADPEVAGAVIEALRALESVAPHGPPEPLPRSLGGAIRRPSRYPRFRESAVRPAFLAGDPPRPADRGPAESDGDPPVPIDPAVRAAALEECGGRWRDIYRYVRTGVEYEPYYGFAQAPGVTLARRAGNDFDQAALLAEMLRVAGVPCRYLHGAMALGREDAAAMAPGAGPGEIGRVFGGTGRPGATVSAGPGQPALRVIEEHLVVEAWVEADDRWVLLDPSWTPSMRSGWSPVASDAAPDPDTEWPWADWPDGIGDLDGTVAARTVARVFESESPAATAPEAVAQPDPSARNRALGRFVSYLDERPGPADEFRCRARAVAWTCNGATTSRWMTVDAWRAPAVTFGYRRDPATDPDDEPWPAAASEWWLELRVDGATVAVAPPSVPGRRDRVILEIRVPESPPVILGKNVRPGARGAIALDFAGAADAAAVDAVAALPPAVAAPPVDRRDPDRTGSHAPGVGDGARVEARLAGDALAYLAAVRARTGALADRLGVRAVVRAPAAVACMVAPVTTDPSLPVDALGYEWTLDQLANEHAAVAIGVPDDRVGDYVFGAGIIASVLERRILELAAGAPAVSTTRLLADAALAPGTGLGQERGPRFLRLWTGQAHHVGEWTGMAILTLEPESLAGFYEIAGSLAATGVGDMIRGGVLARVLSTPIAVDGPRRTAPGANAGAWPGSPATLATWARMLGPARQRARDPARWWQGVIAPILAAETLER